MRRVLLRERRTREAVGSYESRFTGHAHHAGRSASERLDQFTELVVPAHQRAVIARHHEAIGIYRFQGRAVTGASNPLTTASFHGPSRAECSTRWAVDAEHKTSPGPATASIR